MWKISGKIHQPNINNNPKGCWKQKKKDEKKKDKILIPIHQLNTVHHHSNRIWFTLLLLFSLSLSRSLSLSLTFHFLFLRLLLFLCWLFFLQYRTPLSTYPSIGVTVTIAVSWLPLLYFLNVDHPVFQTTYFRSFVVVRCAQSQQKHT